MTKRKKKEKDWRFEKNYQNDVIVSCGREAVEAMLLMFAVQDDVVGREGDSVLACLHAHVDGQPDHDRVEEAFLV